MNTEGHFVYLYGERFLQKNEPDPFEMKIYKLLIITFVFFCTHYLSAFSQDTISTEEPVFVVVEEAPEFPGGQEAMMRYLADTIKLEDISPLETIPLTLYIGFVIDTDGSVTDVKILRSSTNPSLDKAGMEAVRGMPKWKPGRQDGKEVRVGYTIPIKVHPQ